MGVGSEVRIERDAQGVPHIYADTDADLFFAQGYVHAQDRLFEMDYRRHVTAGRLSELVGENEDVPAEPRVSFDPEGINLYSNSWRVEI